MATVAPPRPVRAWEMRPQSPEAARRISQETGLGPVASRVMAARGWDDPQAVREFLTGGLSTLHDPMTLPDMERAVARLIGAIRGGERICIYGDYDVDGTTGSAVLLKTLSWLGVTDVRHETPHRVQEGYGIHPEAVDRLAEEGVRLIVTVDNGTTAHAALARARERGIDVIVVDHHLLDQDAPEALALVNPWRAESEYPFPDLCGCALAFKLSQALTKAMGRSGEEAKPFLTGLIDLVALATVADVMPLRGENRAIVRHGLRLLGNSAHLGLRALITTAGLTGKLTSDNIGWVLGPRLNAAGRTSHASLAVDLLTTEDPAHAQHLAEHLEKLNRERQRIEQVILDEALQELEAHRDDPVVVLARPGWHIGVLGIVASRILERTEKPTILMAIEETLARGSGRSIPGFDLHAALCACAEHLESFGGHPMAAGVKCLPGRIEAFREALIAHALSLGPECLAPRPHTVDTELGEDELVAETLEDLAHLEPHGEGHPRPLFALRDLRLATTPQVLKERHLKLRLLTQGGRPLTAIAFQRVDRLGELLPAPRALDLVGRLSLNEWNGHRTVEMIISDWRVHRP